MPPQPGNFGVLRVLGSQVEYTLLQLRLQRTHKALRHGKSAVSNLGHKPLTGSRARLVRGATHPVEGFTIFIKRFERALIFQ